MGFLTQRLANRLRKDMKIRRDPSALGQRLLSGLGEIADDIQISNKWLSEEWYLLARRLGTPRLWSVVLDEDDLYPVSVDDGGHVRRAVPTLVEGTDGLGTHTLAYVDTIEELTNGVPDVLISEGTETYTSRLIYENGNINSGHPTERLLVAVTGSTDYYPRARRGNETRSGVHAVYIWGKDENSLDVMERVDVPLDGYYLTQNWFSAVTKVDYEGFDGTLEITLPDIPGWRVDPFRTLVLPNREGQLLLTLDVDGGESHLGMKLDILKSGEEFLQGSTQPIDNQDGLGWLLLRDSGGSGITAVDMDIDPETARLWVLSDDGYVHIYDHDLPEFGTPSEQIETVDSYVELHAETNYERLDADSPMWTYFARLRHPVLKLIIKRVAPDGTTEYLDEDRVWQPTSQDIVGKTQPNNIFDSLPHFKFSNTYDQTGQWDFYCTCYTEFDTTVYHTAVYVYELIALASFDSGVAVPTGCYFGQAGYFSVVDAAQISYFSSGHRKYYADFTNGELVLASEFTSVEVTP